MAPTVSTLYTGPFSVVTSSTLKVKAWHPDHVASAAYTIAVAAPALTPGAGSYTAGQLITVATATAGATITTVTDPFGRAATFSYDENGRLQRITDVIALWSSFTYAADGFLTSLTTPYGTSRFTASDNGYNRTLEMTDPVGGKERIEYRGNDLTMSAQDAAATVPTVAGFTFNNNFLQYRNTLYWDRKAMLVGAGDRTRAHLYHWLHVKDNVNQSVAGL